jgi:imidazolonepropionase-like amidohydrolase
MRPTEHNKRPPGVGVNKMKRFLPMAFCLMMASPTAAEESVIRAAKIYTMTGTPLAPGVVRIQDGKITEVGSNLEPHAGAKVVDLGTGVLLPGLVDAHDTLALEGGNAESTLEITPNVRVLDAVDWSHRTFRAARSDGITTIALAPSTENVIAGRSCIVKTAGDPARRIIRKDHALVITAASDPSNGNQARNRPDSIYNRQPTNRMGVIWMLRSELGRAKAGSAAQAGPLGEALKGKRPVVCVSRIDADILSALRLREEFPLNLTIAGGQEAYKVRDALAAARVGVLLGKQSTTPGNGPESSETVLNTAGLLNEAGVPFALTGGELLAQARFAVRHGLPRDAALAAITLTPAKLLGIDARIGAIAVGRDADLVALSGDPFDLSAVVRWTMTDGVIYSEEP